jgi:alpha-2-macroglobulin
MSAIRAFLEKARQKFRNGYDSLALKLRPTFDQLWARIHPLASYAYRQALTIWEKLPPSLWLRRGVATLAIAALLSLPAIAFFSGAAAPALTLPGERAPAKPFDDKTLQIVQATPEGKISLGDERKEIFVVFTHPMVPLAALAETTKGVFTISPRVKGKFRWYGSRICAFVPNEDWRQGAEYTVTVDRSTHAINGQKLTEAKVFKFRFEVPPLRIENIRPETYSKIKYATDFTVEFNFPIAKAELANHLRITSEGKAVQYEISESARYDWRARTNIRDGKTWKIKPLAKFGKAAKVEVSISRGLKADKLLTQLPEDYSKSYETYGDLSVDFVNKARSWSDRDSIAFKFSNPVDAKVAARAIKFDPPRKVLWLPQGETTELGLTSWNVEPGITYKMTINPFRDVLGNNLTNPGSHEATLPDRESFFNRVESGSILEAEMAQNYPLNVSNIQTMNVRISTFSLEDVLQYASQSKHYSLDRYLLSRDPNSKDISFKTGIQHNAVGRAAFNLTPYTEKNRGWLFAQFRDPANDSEKDQYRHVQAAVQSTDLGITARPALDGNHVWVHSLTRGLPVARAAVTRYTGSSKNGQCETNAEGYCFIKEGKVREGNEALVYVATKDNDRAFITSKEQRLSINPSTGSFAYEITRDRLMGVVVFDRKLHTPGDTVYFRAVLTHKKGDQLQALAGKEMQVEISSADGKSIYSENIKTSDQGGLGGQIDIPKDAPLGHYNINISRKDQFGSQHVADNFQIEEFRPVGFAVSVAGLADSIAGKTLTAVVEGNYLFGAPMQSARLQVDVSRSKSSTNFSNYPDFNFGDQKFSYYGESDEADSGFFTGTSGKLAPNGKFSFQIPLAQMISSEKIDLPESSKLQLASPYTMHVDATVRDVDDKSVSNRRSVSVATGKIVTGIRAKERYASLGAKLEFDIVALNNAGQATGSVPVKIRVIHITWKSVRTQGADESMMMKNHPVRRLVMTETLAVSDKAAGFTFTPDKPGEYYILAQPEGETGFARTGFYVSGASDGFYMRDDDALSMVADKAHYAPGETAKVVIQSPYKTGRAIISLEREKIYWQKQVELTDYALTVPVEIKQEYLPNVYLTVLIIKPRETLSKRTVYEDLGAPGFKVGSMSLSVDNSSRRAKFSLAYDRPQYGPGDNVKISINTESNAEIALSVADRAVLDLVNYHFEDPMARFFNNWSLAVELFENRHAIIHQYDFSGKGKAPGGGPGEYGEEGGKGGFGLDSEDGTRKNFRYTAFWKGDIRADKKGKAELNFKLPDNLSTFRIMALAAADGKYADYEKEFRVQKALVVQPLMPRFIRPGDELQIGAVVINQTGADGEFAVDLTGDLLAKNGASTIQLKAGESREVSFGSRINVTKYAALLKAYREKPAPIKPEKVSEAAIMLSGFVSARPMNTSGLVAKGFKAADLVDKVKFEFPVLESPAAEAFAISGFTDTKVSEAIVVPTADDVLGNLGSLDLSLSSTALVGLDNAFHFYSLNPYACLEQRSSAFLLAVTAGELLKNFSVKPRSSSDYDFSRIEALFLGELDQFVNADGGLLLWKKSPLHINVSNPYLSAYVLSILQVAEKKQYRTDSSIRAGVVKYLENYLKSTDKGNRHWMLESLAMVNLVLAREGNYQGDVTKFLLKNEELLSVRAKARLALTIAVRDNVKSFADNKDTKRLVEFLRSRLEVTTTSVMIKEIANAETTQAFYSQNSALAVVLETFIRLDKTNSLIPQMVTHLMQNRAGYDTHSIGLMATAFDEYRQTYEMTAQPFNFMADITLGSTKIFSHELNTHKLDVWQKTLNMLELRQKSTPGKQQPFSFSKTAAGGRLYYSARLTYAPARLGENARDEGIEIHRNLFSVQSSKGRQIVTPIKGDRLSRGELYLQKLMVTTPKPYYNVVIVDPLSSQTEVMNSAFQTEKSGSDAAMTSGAENNSEDSNPYEENYYWGMKPTRTEYRHDKVVFFFDYIPPGYHEYKYMIRPVVRGSASHPPGQAKLMYEPEIFGRSSSMQRRVE